MGLGCGSGAARRAKTLGGGGGALNGGGSGFGRNVFIRSDAGLGAISVKWSGFEWSFETAPEKPMVKSARMAAWMAALAASEDAGTRGTAVIISNTF